MCVCAHACPSAISTFEQVDQFSQVWYEDCTIFGRLNLNLNVIRLMITVWQTLELVRWGVTLATLNSPGLMDGDRSMQNIKLYEIKIL
jgi:hypothetical protein